MKAYKLFLFANLFLAADLAALPFNDDMVDGQIKIGQSMRAAPDGTIPVGYANFKRPVKGEGKDIPNPFPANEESISKGKRLFEVNCTTCHGDIAAKDYKTMPAGSRLGAPNLADPLYNDRTPGWIFSVVQNGNILMPAMGYKLSDREIWDIANYVKDVQKNAAVK